MTPLFMHLGKSLPRKVVQRYLEEQVPISSEVLLLLWSFPYTINSNCCTLERLGKANDRLIYSDSHIVVVKFGLAIELVIKNVSLVVSTKRCKLKLIVVSLWYYYFLLKTIYYMLVFTSERKRFISIYP